MPNRLPHSHPATKPPAPESSQIDKFKEAAQALDCDNDEQRFNERVKKLMARKPVEKPA